MKPATFIFNKTLLFELIVDAEQPEINVWEVTLKKGEIILEKKPYQPEDSLEKWKHRMSILCITGEQVMTKLYTAGDPSIKKITENKELIYQVTPSQSTDEVVVSFLRKEPVEEITSRLNKAHIHVLDRWMGKNQALDKEKRLTDFYQKELRFRAIKQVPGRLNTVCHVACQKLQLPVLLFFFLLLLGNFFVNSSLRKEYEQLQSELYLKQRNDKTFQENQKKQGRIQAQYQKIPECSFALIADRIASYVPPSIRLSLLTVFPVEGSDGSLANRHKEVKVKTGIIQIKGEVEIPGSVTLFTQFLSSDLLFSKVEIISLTRQKDAVLFNFELKVTLSTGQLITQNLPS